MLIKTKSKDQALWYPTLSFHLELQSLTSQRHTEYIFLQLHLSFLLIYVQFIAQWQNLALVSAGISYGCRSVSQLPQFPFQFAAYSLGKQQKTAHGLRTLSPRNPRKSFCSWFWIGSALVNAAVWGVNQRMQHHPISPTLGKSDLSFQ